MLNYFNVFLVSSHHLFLEDSQRFVNSELLGVREAWTVLEVFSVIRDDDDDYDYDDDVIFLHVN